MLPTKVDTRFVYGAKCLFMGPIQLVAKTPSGLPCCPHCGGVLYQCDSKEAFLKGASDYAKGHPGYLEMAITYLAHHEPSLSDSQGK